MSSRERGSVRQTPSGRWQARLSVGYRADGRQRTTSATFDKEREARAWIAEKSLEMGADPLMHARVTLEDVWERYKRTKGERLARTTMSDYSRHMRRLWIPRLGDTDVSEITTHMIQTALLSCSTREVAKAARRVLSSVLSNAQRDGLLSKHPMRGVRFEMPGDTGSEWENEDVWDDDPFATIERSRDVWDAETALKALPRMRGLPLEPVWLACVGGGLRVEEAFALRRMDIRRVEVMGRDVTQVAVHHATTKLEDRKRTKTRGSVRIVTVIDPFGERLWELAQGVGTGELVCSADPANQNKRWRSYFDKPRKHKRMSEKRMVSGRLMDLPYIPLSRMRATHSTMMQEAGVMDLLNAYAHGHSERVARDHYLRGRMDGEAEQVRLYLERLDNVRS